MSTPLQLAQRDSTAALDSHARVRARGERVKTAAAINHSHTGLGSKENLVRMTACANNTYSVGAAGTCTACPPNSKSGAGATTCFCAAGSASAGTSGTSLVCTCTSSLAEIV